VSKQGWRDFLAADGVDDRVVLHGGAALVFRVPSLRAAARLAEAIAEGPGRGRERADDGRGPRRGTWTLADCAGNQVCICAWPGGAQSDGRPS
jgi:hypothetical protein